MESLETGAKPLTFSISSAESSLEEDDAEVDSIKVTGADGAYIIKTSAQSLMGHATKAAPVTDLSTYGAFCLYGYIYTSWSDAVRPDYMLAEKVSRKNSIWSTQNAFVNTTGSRKVRFFGYAPYGAPGISVEADPSGPLEFTYTVPSATTEQKDLLVASSEEMSGSLGSMSLYFTHCLSAITFKTGAATVNGTIKRISLKGIYGQGTYTCSRGWSGLDLKTDISHVSDIPLTEGVQGKITSGESTMMLIPQTVPYGATLEVELFCDGKTSILSAPIAGDTWDEGKECIYTLSFDSAAGMHIALGESSLTLDWGQSKDIAVIGDPVDQDWTNSITGTGLSAQKISSSVVRVSNNNISGTDSNGVLTVTTQDGKRQATATVLGRSLQESISLTPESMTIAYGATETITASGTYPNGYSLNSPTGVSASSAGNAISVKNVTTSYTATDITLTATTALMGKTASVPIHLSAKPETIYLDKDSLSIPSGSSKSLTVSGDHAGFTATLSSTEFSGVSISGNTVTITNSNTTYDAKTVFLTATTTGDTHANISISITLEPAEEYDIEIL